MKNMWFGRSLLTVDGLKRDAVEHIFSRADEMKTLVAQKGGDDRLSGRIMAALFYEPSSRTCASFLTAMQRLGGGILPFAAMREHSSVVKGETIPDTARVFSAYADVLVIRHNEMGAPKRLAESATVPVVNAGDGSGEHPTQAILDGYTMHRHFGGLKGLTVGLMGDLLYGRTVHSLSRLLHTMGVTNFVFIAPHQLKMPAEITKTLRQNGATVVETEDFVSALPTLDVIYATRVQKERFSDLAQYEKLKHAYVVTPKVMKAARKKAVLMHPLPRVGEIDPAMDTDPRAIYFTRQVPNGLFVRMAILDSILRERNTHS